MHQEDDGDMPQPTDKVPWMDPDFWTPKRRRILEWLNRNAPPLGDLYTAAVYMVSDSSFPGRVHLVSHAAREIWNRLPDVVLGEPGCRVERVEYVNELDNIAKIWQSKNLPIDGSLPTTVTTSPDLPNSDEIPVPRKVYLKVAALVKKHLQAREASNERLPRLISTISPDNSENLEHLLPVISMWKTKTLWFVKRTHVGSPSGEASEIDETELARHFAIFEDVLSIFACPFFTPVAELDGILEEANMMAEESNGSMAETNC